MSDTNSTLDNFKHGWLLWLFRPSGTSAGKIRSLAYFIATSGVALAFQHLTLRWGIILPPTNQSYEILNYAAPFVVSLLGFILFPKFNGSQYVSLIAWLLRIFCIHSTFVVLLALIVGHELEESGFYESKAAWESALNEHLDSGNREETFSQAKPIPPDWSAFSYSFFVSGALLILLISLAIGSSEKADFSERFLDPPNRPSKTWRFSKKALRNLARFRVQLCNLFWSIAATSRVVRGFRVTWKYVLIYVILVGVGKLTGFLSPAEHWWVEHWPSDASL